MRDADTFETAISAAETGHLVFTTLHAARAQQAVMRLFEYFPPEKHELVRRRFRILRGIIVQKLLPSLEEVVIVFPPRRSWSWIPLSAALLRKVNSTRFSRFWMSHQNLDHSFNKELFRLVKEGKVSRGTSSEFSESPRLGDESQGIFLSESNRIIGN